MMSFEDKVSLMIPAYLRGELSEDERQEIENLAAKNPEITADIEFQKNLRNPPVEEVITVTLGDLGWARLINAMDVSRQSKEPAG